MLEEKEGGAKKYSKKLLMKTSQMCQKMQTYICRSQVDYKQIINMNYNQRNIPILIIVKLLEIKSKEKVLREK
jgi:hypothetical protein